MRRRSSRRLARTGFAGSIAALCLAAPTVAAETASSTAGGPAEAAGSQKLTILKQTATPDELGRPEVYIDCDECKGTVTLLTADKQRDKLGSGKFRKTSSAPVGLAFVKLNSEGRKLNKKAKVTVLARARAGKQTAEREIKLRKGVSPCDVVTPGEVATVLGEPVAPGSEVKDAITLGSGGRMCRFEAVAKESASSSYLTPDLLINVVRGAAGPRALQFLPVFYGGPGELTPVSGVGERAFFVNDTFFNNPMTELHAVKDDTYVTTRPSSHRPGLRRDLQPALVNAAFARLK